MSIKRTPTEARQKTLGWFARQPDPFGDPALILARLRLESSESEYLEWKLTPPAGPAVLLRTKYRVVKAVVSFANTEGGFVVFGVGPKGQWVGFTPPDLQHTDAAALAELINGCISPEITGLNYAELQHGSRLYPVLHVPPSPLMPHVTTKDVQERLPDGQHIFHLYKYAVYCRYTAKSDLATPAQFARIIAFRTDFLKAEMLRRVKEVEVPFTGSALAGLPGHPTILRVSHSAKDPSLPAVRITRNPAEAAGLIVQEELSDGIFDEINNVLDANKLLAKDRPEFLLGQEVYYRVYAERQHVQGRSSTYDLLARAAASRFYAPCCYWLLQLSPAEVARIIRNVLQEQNSQHTRLICRLAILMGRRVTSWLKQSLDDQWARHSQPAAHYFMFNEMLARVGSADPRLVALQVGPGSEAKLPEDSEPLSCGELLDSSQLSGACLSKACMSVFKGDKTQRAVCRFLDILTYGGDFARMDERICVSLQENPEGEPTSVRP